MQFTVWHGKSLTNSVRPPKETWCGELAWRLIRALVASASARLQCSSKETEKFLVRNGVHTKKRRTQQCISVGGYTSRQSLVICKSCSKLGNRSNTMAPTSWLGGGYRHVVQRRLVMIWVRSDTCFNDPCGGGGGVLFFSDKPGRRRLRSLAWCRAPVLGDSEILD